MCKGEEEADGVVVFDANGSGEGAACVPERAGRLSATWMVGWTIAFATEAEVPLIVSESQKEGESIVEGVRSTPGVRHESEEGEGRGGNTADKNWHLVSSDGRHVFATWNNNGTVITDHRFVRREWVGDDAVVRMAVGRGIHTQL